MVLLHAQKSSRISQQSPLGALAPVPVAAIQPSTLLLMWTGPSCARHARVWALTCSAFGRSRTQRLRGRGGSSGWAGGDVHQGTESMFISEWVRLFDFQQDSCVRVHPHLPCPAPITWDWRCMSAGSHIRWNTFVGCVCLPPAVPISVPVPTSSAPRSTPSPAPMDASRATSAASAPRRRRRCAACVRGLTIFMAVRGGDTGAGHASGSG
jgi:hypothetical protein